MSDNKSQSASPGNSLKEKEKDASSCWLSSLFFVTSVNFHQMALVLRSITVARIHTLISHTRRAHIRTSIVRDNRFITEKLDSVLSSHLLLCRWRKLFLSVFCRRPKTMTTRANGLIDCNNKKRYSRRAFRSRTQLQFLKICPRHCAVKMLSLA